MGNDCASQQRSNLNLYENTILNGEKKLGWYKTETTVLIHGFKKYSRNEKLSLSGLKAAIQFAGISGNDVKHKSTLVGKFFNNLLYVYDDKKFLQERDLCLMAIALGNGSPEDKATELFEIFDTKVQHYLDRKQVWDLFKEYTTVVAVMLPLIGIGTEQEGLLPSTTIHWYQRGMLRNIKDVIKAIMNQLMNPRSQYITLNKFVRRMSKEDNA